LTTLRHIFSKDLPVVLNGPEKITLFLYNNNTFILRSFLPFNEKITVTVKKTGISLTDLEDGRIYQGSVSEEATIFTLNMAPSVNYVMRIS
jgi:hypothetical protein